MPLSFYFIINSFSSFFNIFKILYDSRVKTQHDSQNNRTNLTNRRSGARPFKTFSYSYSCYLSPRLLYKSRNIYKL